MATLQMDTAGKRSHAHAFPHGSGTQYNEPEQKRSALADAQKAYAKPAVQQQQRSSGEASKALMRNMFRGGKPVPASNRVGTAFGDMDVRFAKLHCVLSKRPRFNGKSKGFLVETGILSQKTGEMIQVGREVAHISPDDPEIVRLAKYYLKEDPNKPDSPGHYLLCGGDNAFHDCALGQALEFKMFLNSAPTEPAIESPDYPFQPFTIVSFEQIKTVDKEGQSGRMETAYKFKESRLIASPQASSLNPNPCDDLIGEVYEHCPPGMVYYVNLTEAPPENSGAAKKSDEVTLPPSDNPEAAAATVVVETAAAKTPENNGSAESAEVVHQDGALSDDPLNADLFADPSTFVAEGSSVAGNAPTSSELSVFDWLPLQPPAVQATHNQTILFVETTLPVFNDARGTVYSEVLYDGSRWARTFKLPDPANPQESIEKELPAFEVAIFGTQWKAQCDTTPAQPSKFLLRISVAARVAPHILGTYNLNTWKLLAPKHLDPALRSRLALSCSGLRKESHALQSENFAKFREENGVDTVVQYKAAHALFALEEHVTAYGWPVSRKTAMGMLLRRYRQAKGAFTPANNVGDRDEVKHVQRHMDFYHPDMKNLLETNKDVMVGLTVVPDDQDLYYVLTPQPYTDEIADALDGLKGSTVINGASVTDKAFEAREGELSDLTGIPQVDEEVRKDAFIVYSIDANKARAALARFTKRRAAERALLASMEVDGEDDADDQQGEGGDDDEAAVEAESSESE